MYEVFWSLDPLHFDVDPDPRIHFRELKDTDPELKKKKSFFFNISGKDILLKTMFVSYELIIHM